MHSNSAAPPTDLVELGRVLGAYGVRGWVKIEPHAAESEALLKVRQWWLRDRQGHTSRPFNVASSRVHSASIVAQLDGVPTREDAALLRGSTVSVPRSAFPSLPDDEYYWVDLVGCRVYGLDDHQPEASDAEALPAGPQAANLQASEADRPVLLGRVTQVSDNGAHGVLHVQRLDAHDTPLLDERGRPLESLVPFVDAHVQAVDLAARRIDTNWPLEF